jgi:hypothetical protein
MQPVVEVHVHEPLKPTHNFLNDFGGFVMLTWLPLLSILNSEMQGMRFAEKTLPGSWASQVRPQMITDSSTLAA